MSDVGRSIKEGIGLGMVAGTVFALAEIVATWIGGDRAIAAFRSAASVLLGPEALAVTPPATAVILGLVAHFYLSAFFGMFYALYNTALTTPTRRSLARQAVIGPLYGLMLWLVNFHVFVPYRYPWLLDLSAAPQALLHAMFYGLPLGLLYGGAERRAVTTRAAASIP